MKTRDWLAIFALAGSVMCVFVDAGSAQSTSAIDVDPAIDCWYHDAFPQLGAAIAPSGDTAQIRLYFRCQQYSDYYFVDLEPTADGYRGIAPRADETCREVSYYVEALLTDFTSTRTAERSAEVTSLNQCRRRHPGALFFDGDPSLVVGTTSTGLSELLGFSTDGVAQFVTAAGEVVGLAADGGGGLGGAAIAGIAAGGAGAVAAVALVSGDDEPDPAGPGPGPPTGGGPPPASSTTTSTIPAGPAVMACFDIGGTGDTITAGKQVSLDARCSTGTNLTFTWDLGDGRPPRDGAFITPIYNVPGVYTVTLTVRQPDGSFRGSLLADVVDTVSRELTVIEGLTACFDTTNLSPGNPPCEIRFDASCSEGDIVRWDWIIDETGVIFSPYVTSGRVVTHSWGFSCSPPPTIRTKLTVTDRDGNTDTITRSHVVRYFTSPFQEASRVTTRFTSFLGVRPFDGTTMGQVHHNDTQVDLVTNAGTKEHNLDGRIGDNTIKAYTTTPLDEPGHWRFDFSATRNFVPGSIRVQSGQVLSTESRSVVFRLSGRAGERIEFKYQLVP